MAHLSARADAAYQNDYHHKLRGRLWDALDGTEYDDRHDDGEPPGFSYSNPFPPHDMEAGDDRKLLVASPDEELLANVAVDRFRRTLVGLKRLYARCRGRIGREFQPN